MTVVLGVNWFACCDHCTHQGSRSGHPDRCSKGCNPKTGEPKGAK